ncbi:Chemotaxis signal transduction protein [Desulfacinum hydrothermale DSM 13146]|uniref:Chemotaxis signal transduction protein n=1 Tax=Desulfacinum hydrothermale DSM 13146 TaxID=1121390 RepID=A0A1W1XCV1_9BACT|nr:chemotaxis protein CheW [Desulfacinum hydrothermale]SMC21865.1 Chemotaxis signal transduction protein [Desulfacinum hydrothermale DSM 13146]
MTQSQEMVILLVEDSAITRKMEIKVLNSLGYHQILEADDGQKAIQVLEQNPQVSLVISDWNMPGMGGLELVRYLRSQEAYRDLPFIMATGRAQMKERMEAAEAGAQNVITKPFAPQELQAVLDDTLSGKTLKGQAASQMRQPEMAPSGKLHLKVAHIQITDHLTLGVLKHFMESGKETPRHFELQTLCMSSWNPVQKALADGEIDAAFILGPIAMDLFSYGVPLRIVLLAHKNGSIAVHKKVPGQPVKALLKGKTFYIPHELSIHHILSHMFLTGLGLRPGTADDKACDVIYEVAPPVRMPEFLSSQEGAGGFMVAEPIGTKAIAGGIADELFLSGEIWENHPCCVVAMRDEIIEQHPEAVQELVRLLVQAGKFISANPETAAEIGVEFLDPQGTLGLKKAIVKNVLTDPLGVKTDDLMPVPEDFAKIQDYMVDRMGLGTRVDLNRLLDLRFAEKACREAGGTVRRSILRDAAAFAREKVEALETQASPSSKANLDREGQYLIFRLMDQDYGVDVLSVKEIVGMMPIRSMPETPPSLKGVVNLRGQVIPVIDLRLKFGLPELAYHDRTCIIILEVPERDRALLVGIVVDSVSHVENIKADQIEDAPAYGLGAPLEYIAGMAKEEDAVRILLNVHRLFSQAEAQAAAGTGGRRDAA